MEIKSTITNKQGETFESVYHEGNPLENLEGITLSGVGTCCFYNDKLVLVKSRNEWGMPGGGIESGEQYENAIEREVLEETNMVVRYKESFGYSDFFMKKGTFRHAFFFCIVEPNGDFISDPDGDITEIKLIDPKDYKEYFNWGEALRVIIEKSLEIKEKIKI
jgi:ADP-ribose pyrophosphatase YjhB (NUDIX family)